METTTDNYTEEQALALVSEFIARFGWKTAIFTDEDIRNSWTSQTGKRMTDEEMAQVKDTRQWVKYFDEALVREGFEFLDEICYDIIKGNEEEE